MGCYSSERCSGRSPLPAVGHQSPHLLTYNQIHAHCCQLWVRETRRCSPLHVDYWIRTQTDQRLQILQTHTTFQHNSLTIMKWWNHQIFRRGRNAHLFEVIQTLVNYRPTNETTTLTHSHFLTQSWIFHFPSNHSQFQIWLLWTISIWDCFQYFLTKVFQISPFKKLLPSYAVIRDKIYLWISHYPSDEAWKLDVTCIRHIENTRLMLTITFSKLNMSTRPLVKGHALILEQAMHLTTWSFTVAKEVMTFRGNIISMI